MLDTNICIYIIKNHPQSVKERFGTLSKNRIYISSITVSEMLYGAYKSQYPEKNLKALEIFISDLQIVDFDYRAADEYAKIRSYLEKQGKIIGQLDMQIAAVAKAMDMVLVTNNTREFDRIKNLKLENWV